MSLHIVVAEEALHRTSPLDQHGQTENSYQEENIIVKMNKTHRLSSED